MNVQVTIQIDGREVQTVEKEIVGNLAEREELAHRVGKEVGRAVAEPALKEAAEQMRRPCCCGRAMNNQGKPGITLQGRHGRMVRSYRSSLDDTPER